MEIQKRKWLIEEMHKNHIDKNTFYQEIAILAFTFVVPAAITQKKNFKHLQ